MDLQRALIVHFLALCFIKQLTSIEIVTLRTKGQGKENHKTHIRNKLKNIHKDVLGEEMPDVVEHYISQLKNSGYDRSQAKEVITCGMVGWLRKLERRKKRGEGQYLSARMTLADRDEKKLLEKTSWYKEDGKRKRENEESQYQYQQTKKTRRGPMTKSKNTTKAGQGKSKIKAVLFIPYTRHLLCETKKYEGKTNSQDCRKRNVVYKTYCITCNERQDKELADKYKDKNISKKEMEGGKEKD